jgi:hypothetical protein
MYLTAAVEAAHALYGQGKRGGTDGGQRRVDVLGPTLVDLADEAQRDMQAFRAHPARPRQTRGQQGQPLADAGRKRQTDEQAHGRAPPLEEQGQHAGIA